MGTGWSHLWREFRISPLAQFGAAMVVLLVVCVAFAPWIAPHDPEDFNLRDRNKPPAFLEGGEWTYPLGTDAHGRDVLSRIIHGARVSLATRDRRGRDCGRHRGDSRHGRGLLRRRVGYVDHALRRRAALDTTHIDGAAGGGDPGPKITNIILVMGGVGWIWHARIVRGNALRIREEQYVLAATNVGTTRVGIMWRHVLPNLLAPVLVTATMQIGYMVILESGLSFFGITGTTLSWGWDISAGRKYLASAWWIASFPGFAIFFTVLSFQPARRLPARCRRPPRKARERGLSPDWTRSQRLPYGTSRTRSARCHGALLCAANSPTQPVRPRKPPDAVPLHVDVCVESPSPTRTPRALRRRSGDSPLRSDAMR